MADTDYRPIIGAPLVLTERFDVLISFVIVFYFCGCSSKPPQYGSCTPVRLSVCLSVSLRLSVVHRLLLVQIYCDLEAQWGDVSVILSCLDTIPAGGDTCPVAACPAMLGIRLSNVTTFIIYQLIR